MFPIWDAFLRPYPGAWSSSTSMRCSGRTICTFTSRVSPRIGIGQRPPRSSTYEIIDILGLKPGDRLLDAPCGHGRLANLLAAAGILVTGVDSSVYFLDKARSDSGKAGTGAEYRQGDLRDLPIGDDGFDAVINWFTSFGYFGDDENRRVLREFHRVLRPGGTLLIETMYRDGIVRAFPAIGSTHVERAGPTGDDLMVDSSIFDGPSGRLETQRIIVRGGNVSTSNYSIRLPALTEFRDWLKKAGFQSVRFQSRRGEPLTLDSRLLVVFAQA